MSYTLTSQQSGGLDGVLTNDGTLWLEARSSALELSILGMFTGTVHGWGQGNLALSFPLTAGSLTMRSRGPT
jgi:hypothetical protein